MSRYYYLPKSDPFYIGVPHKKKCPKPKRSIMYFLLKKSDLKMQRDWEKIKGDYLT